MIINFCKSTAKKQNKQIFRCIFHDIRTIYPQITKKSYHHYANKAQASRHHISDIFTSHNINPCNIITDITGNVYTFFIYLPN